MTPTIFEELATLFSAADVVVVTSGAGMSVDSGVPTYRGKDANSESACAMALKAHDITYEYIMRPIMFDKRPNLAWAFCGAQYNLYGNIPPHQGHTQLLKLLQQKQDYFVVTSNVDSAFKKAGYDPERIYEIHGRVEKLQCHHCNTTWDYDGIIFDVDIDNLTLHSPIPTCVCCGNTARPNVMLFGGREFVNAETTAQAVKFTSFMHKYDKGNHNILILEFGAGEGVPTIRIMGEFIHERVPGAKLVRVNPMETTVPAKAISIDFGALETIGKLYNILG